MSATAGAEPHGAVLGVDVGGTSIKARLVDAHGTVLEHWRQPTPPGDATGERTADAIAEIARAASARASVQAVGFVVPGVVDIAAGVCLKAVNLGWDDLPIRDIVAAHLSAPVAFGHDVRAGALAEARSGAAADVRGVSVFLPVGTGLAAGYARNGRLFELGPAAGEVGQVVLRSGESEGVPIESVASASGIARRAGQPDAASVAALVRAGDERATSAWNAGVDVLADTIAWLAAVLNPEAVVIGGGLSAAGELLFGPLREGLAGRLGPIAAPDLRTAVHGDAAAMVGAVMMAGDLLADAGTAGSAGGS